MTSRDDGRPRKADEGRELVLRGIGVSPGVAVGPVVLLGVEAEAVAERAIAPEEVGRERARFEDTLIETRRQVREIQKNLSAHVRGLDAGILDGHLMVLDDVTFTRDVLEAIEGRRRNAESAVRQVGTRQSEALSRVADDYLRERVADIRDVVRRLLRNLSGTNAIGLRRLTTRSVIVATDLAPSETASLPKGLALGFVTDGGSPTSHSAMMARALEIPAVVGMRDATARLAEGDEVLIDGNKGLVIVRPTQERLQLYGRLVEERRQIVSGLTDLKNAPAETKGGRRVRLGANIELPEEVDAVLAYGAEGVGLYRSEYAYLAAKSLPSEESLAEDYGRVARRLAPLPLIIRTIDIGGDKLASFIGLPTEANPFLGLRSIRLALAEPEMFRAQLRAILRASVHRNVQIMYPMITSAEEVAQANELLGLAKRELREAGVPFHEEIPVGVMIETPSAALSADLLAPMVKFFSIGTNDLIQYAMAVDRGNERVAYLYQPTHPGILRLIRMAIDAAHRHGLWAGVCGEMAADPLICPLLVGLGADELSVSPSAVPLIKDVIRSLTTEDATALAQRAMEAQTAAEVRDLCRDLIRRVAPEVLELVG